MLGMPLLTTIIFYFHIYNLNNNIINYSVIDYFNLDTTYIILLHRVYVYFAFWCHCKKAYTVNVLIIT